MHVSCRREDAIWQVRAHSSMVPQKEMGELGARQALACASGSDPSIADFGLQIADLPTSRDPSPGCSPLELAKQDGARWGTAKGGGRTGGSSSLAGASGSDFGWADGRGTVAGGENRVYCPANGEGESTGTK